MSNLNLSNAQFGQHNKMDMDIWYGQAWKMANQEPFADPKRYESTAETASPNGP